MITLDFSIRWKQKQPGVKWKLLLLIKKKKKIESEK